jgi:beta-glucosidase
MHIEHRLNGADIGRILPSVWITMALLPALAQSPSPAPMRPWMDRTLTPDKRAELILGQMSLDEKLAMVHGVEGPTSLPIGGAGHVVGIPRLGIPEVVMTDGRSGVGNTDGRGRYATALPAALACAASWDRQMAYDFGALIGKEARDLGFQVSLGGTANLVRELRNGRNFECFGEDPVLIGKMLGRVLKGTQDQGVIGNINRYAVNDQETGRRVGNAILDRRAMRESDLLAFEIAIQESGVGTVMCAYNKVNSDYACDSRYLLTDVLKKAWSYQGWVMTDWGAAHSTVKAALAGLDQEMSSGTYFGEKLKTAVLNNEVPMARLDDMVRRILRTEIAFGILDNPVTVVNPVDPFAGAETAQRVAEQGIVLLKNSNGSLPLKAPAVKSIAVIGSHADVGVLSGAGSDQVAAAGGNPVPGGRAIWHRSSPLKAIRAKVPHARVEYDPGTAADQAASLAARSEVAIVFVNQFNSEGRDVPNLSLPDGQDELVSRVAAANPRTIVVLETGCPITMPWIGSVSAVLEAWYPGIRGGEAIANILFGESNPSGRLPITFPRAEADLPHPKMFAPPGFTPGNFTNIANQLPPFEIQYSEGAKVGYKWFDAEKKEPLFAFGFGLSYTTFAYSGLRTTAGLHPEVSFRVTNTGKREGAETAQVYVSLPAASGEQFKRLTAWEKVSLAPGQTKTITLTLDPQFLSVFDTVKDAWQLLPGEYGVFVGGSSRATPLTGTIRLSRAQ